MTMSIEANKLNENDAILKELDELMTYMGDDSVESNEELIDPTFFIGNLEEPHSEVPTLTSVADESIVKTESQEANDRQPGLFSERVAQIKKAKNQEIPSEEITAMVDAIIAKNLPLIEAQLREQILDRLNNQKNS